MNVERDAQIRKAVEDIAAIIEDHWNSTGATDEERDRWLEAVKNINARHEVF